MYVANALRAAGAGAVSGRGWRGRRERSGARKQKASESDATRQLLSSTARLAA